MKSEILKINKSFLNNMAKMKFDKISKNENADEIFKRISDNISPKIYYRSFFDIKKEKRETLLIDSIYEIKSDEVSEIPKEILAGAILYCVTVGDIQRLMKENCGIFYETMMDLAGTSYVDAMREYLKEEMEERYIVGANLIPGVNTDIENIKIIDKLLKFENMGIELNEYMTMIPEKSACGIFLIYEASHPENKNDCSTCMARGRGCDLCHQGVHDV